MIDEETKNLLKNYLEGTLSEEERARVEKWIESELAQESASHVTLDDTRKRLLLNRLHASMRGKQVRVIPIRRWIQVAAAILLITFSYYTWNSFRAEQTLYSLAGNGIEKVILPDGSIVWLKANSKLTYPKAFGNQTREVKLEGEALFEVYKDATHPFIIQCGELTATVLGTSFNIRESRDTIEVAVLTGKVGLTTPNDIQSVIVLPHEKAIYTMQRVAKLETTSREITSITSTTEYNMDFRQTSLREIITRIEGKFGVAVQLHESNILDCSMTADFTDQSLEVTLRNISNVLDFKYAIEANTVSISGGSCQ